MIIRGNINEIRPLLESYMKAYVESFKTTLKTAEKVGKYKKDVGTYLVGEYKPFILAGYPDLGQKELIKEVLDKYNLVGEGMVLFPKVFDYFMNPELIFDYLPEPYVQGPVVRFEYMSEDLLEKVSDAGYDVYVLTFDRELFFEWANHISKDGHRNVDKFIIDYLKDNPNYIVRDWTKITERSNRDIFDKQYNSSGPSLSSWARLTDALHSKLENLICGLKPTEEQKELYKSLIVDGNLDFIKIKQVLSGMIDPSDNGKNPYDKFIKEVKSELKQPYLPPHIKSAIWAKISEA